MTLAPTIAIKHYGTCFSSQDLQALEDAITSERERCIALLSKRIDPEVMDAAEIREALETE